MKSLLFWVNSHGSLAGLELFLLTGRQRKKRKALTAHSSPLRLLATVQRFFWDNYHKLLAKSPVEREDFKRLSETAEKENKFNLSPVAENTFEKLQVPL